MRSLWLKLTNLFWYGDTTIIRIILATASLVWALCLLLAPSTFERNGYALMRHMASAPVWAGLYLLHFLGVFWRFVDDKERVRAALIINVYGLSLWMVSTMCINLSTAMFTPVTALEWTMCCFGAWSLFRTGLRQEFLTS